MFREALNIWWSQWTWPLKLGTLAAIAILLLIVFFSFKSCFKSEPTVITEQEKQEILNDIEDRNEAKLKEKLVAIEVKEKIIEGNVANADSEKINAIADSRKKWANANVEELRAEYERRFKEQ